MTWLYQGVPFTEPTEEMVGFVYEIHDLDCDRFYIGKKLFWTTQKLPPLKGKTRCRHRRTQSNWRTYYGSNRALSARVSELGPEQFQRTILHICRSRSLMSWWETKTQIDLDVLRDPRYYNEIIACKISSRGLKTT